MAKTVNSQLLAAATKAAETSATLAVEVRAHIEADRLAFVSLEKKLDDAETDRKAMADDIKSLLNSRTFARGMWKAATIVAGLVAAVVSTVLHYIRG